jgi:hypothetical protein
MYSIGDKLTLKIGENNPVYSIYKIISNIGTGSVYYFLMNITSNFNRIENVSKDIMKILYKKI